MLFKSLLRVRNVYICYTSGVKIDLGLYGRNIHEKG